MTDHLENLLSRDDFFVKQITKIVDDNLQNEELSSAFLAAACFMSHRHFSRRVKQTMGIDATRFIHSQRILKACELLRDTCLPVSAIYIKCGFGSANYFTRVFRRQMGMPPTAYRNEKNKKQ